MKASLSGSGLFFEDHQLPGNGTEPASRLYKGKFAGEADEEQDQNRINPQLAAAENQR